MTSPLMKRSASPASSAMAARIISSSDVVSGNADNIPNETSANPKINGNLALPRVRPPARSSFDLEPNPFEHSFSSTSNVSQDTPKREGTSGNSNSNHTNPVADNVSNNLHEGNPNGAADTQGKHERDVKPMLPPLAALESPADHGFGSWGLASSLRSGPLSPAMLAGPATQQTPSLGLGAFDSSFVRTGLTPDVNRTGLTPLIGGPSGFPPPSPNTAALFALVNGTSSSGSMATNVAITPGTLNAITGVLGSHSLNSIHQPTSISLDQPNQQLIDGQPHPQHQQHQQPPQHQTGQYNPQDSYSIESASHAISNAASALYLLSQQQNLQRHKAQTQGQVNPSAVSGMPQHPQADSPTTTANPSSITSTRRSTKRKSAEAPVPQPRGKKQKPTNAVSARGATRRRDSKTDDVDDDGEDIDEEDDDDDIYTEGTMLPLHMGSGSRSNGTATKSGGGGKKPETEEEKRRNFLERNRQAALKCRQRKKAWLTALQQKVEFLTTENERLTGALVTSREEIARLSQAVVAQGGAPSTLLSEHSPIAGNGNGGPNGMMGEGSPVSPERDHRGSVSGSSVGAAHQQPVHINVNVAMPNIPNGSQANGNGGMGHAHSHSHPIPPSQPTQGRGHTRAHSHGHNHVPANGVTVGGRGYGY